MQAYLAEDLVLGRLIEEQRAARQRRRGPALAAEAPRSAPRLLGRGCESRARGAERLGPAAVQGRTLPGSARGAGDGRAQDARERRGPHRATRWSRATTRPWCWGGRGAMQAEALAISRELAREAESRWGANDATTLRFRNAVMADYTDLGQYADALIAHEAVYRTRARPHWARARPTRSARSAASPPPTACWRACARGAEPVAAGLRPVAQELRPHASAHPVRGEARWPSSCGAPAAWSRRASCRCAHGKRSRACMARAIPDALRDERPRERYSMRSATMRRPCASPRRRCRSGAR